ncbi:VOC family protein [Geoalkalibacter sp.]|uniref:VOC family protein n=1 Tax=Geoalkalibacter sp. TaxID=3041440 RepID=UPI00272E206C|nr:VOC family protein [Geoalkalibacter sp.]
MTIRMIAPLEVGICCRNLSEMRLFYEETLGFSFIGEAVVAAETAVSLGLSAEGYKVVRLQTPYGERIKLLASDTPPAAGTSFTYFLENPGATYLTFIVDNIGATIKRLLASGITFITGSESVQVRPGVQAAFCRDPEGNTLELVEFADISSYRQDLKKADLSL